MLRKKTSRQLPFGQMIRNAITADALPAAGFVGTIAFFQIMILFAFHRVSFQKTSRFLQFPVENFFPTGWGAGEGVPR